jgi:hypothetical protein
MRDLFSRIGTVLGHLLSASTVHGPAKEEATRLIEELEAADVAIEEIVAERVRAAIEGLDGRALTLEERHNELSAIVFSAATAAVVLLKAEETGELEHLQRIFDGRANPMDLDGDGASGGSLPVPPTDDPDEMTVAMLKAALNAAEVEYSSSALKPELVQLLKDFRATAVEPTPPAPEAETTMVPGGGSDVVA